MGLHFDHKSKSGERAMEKERKRLEKLAEKKAKREAKREAEELEELERLTNPDTVPNPSAEKE
ncbi:hypothetical protein OAV49_02465 [Alphaproteobacteria bacterium]|nr:hypothetical protein [Alphaproteobacteria bacterium]